MENRRKKEITQLSKSYVSHQAIPNKVFDSAVSHPMMFNSFMDMDPDETHSTTMYSRDGISRHEVSQVDYLLECL